MPRKSTPAPRKPTPPPRLSYVHQRKYDWEAIAMAARLLARKDPTKCVTVGSGILRAHAYQINTGQKAPMRPVGHYKAYTRGRQTGHRATLLVQYLGPPLPDDSPAALRGLLDRGIGLGPEEFE